MIFSLIAVSWLAIGVVDYGVMLSYYTERFPAFKHFDVMCMTVVLGPIGLLATFITGQYNGRFRWVPLNKEQRWEAHQRLWPSLSRQECERSERR